MGQVFLVQLFVVHLSIYHYTLNWQLLTLLNICQISSIITLTMYL